MKWKRMQLIYLLGNLEIPTTFFPEHLAWINAMADRTYIAS